MIERHRNCALTISYLVVETGKCSVNIVEVIAVFEVVLDSRLSSVTMVLSGRNLESLGAQ